jgi:hypothetical protein
MTLLRNAWGQISTEIYQQSVRKYVWHELRWYKNCPFQRYSHSVVVLRLGNSNKSEGYTNRNTQAEQVKWEEPNKEECPVPPGWGLTLSWQLGTENLHFKLQHNIKSRLWRMLYKTSVDITKSRLWQSLSNDNQKL